MHEGTVPAADTAATIVDVTVANDSLRLALLRRGFVLEYATLGWIFYAAGEVRGIFATRTDER